MKFRFWVALTIGLEAGVLLAIIPVNIGLLLVTAVAFGLFREIDRRLS